MSTRYSAPDTIPPEIFFDGPLSTEDRPLGRDYLSADREEFAATKPVDWPLFAARWPVPMRFHRSRAHDNATIRTPHAALAEAAPPLSRLRCASHHTREDVAGLRFPVHRPIDPTPIDREPSHDATRLMRDYERRDTKAHARHPHSRLGIDSPRAERMRVALRLPQPDYRRAVASRTPRVMPNSESVTARATARRHSFRCWISTVAPCVHEIHLVISAHVPAHGGGD